MGAVRTSRWVIGLAAASVLLGLLSLASFGAVLSRRIELQTDGRNPAVFRTYTARTMATVLDVAPDPALHGQAKATVEFVPAGGERLVTSVLWPDELPPEVGDQVEVAYDPDRPQYAAEGGEVLRHAEQAGGLDRIAEEPPGFRPALVAAGLAALSLGGAVLCARRGSRRASR